MSFREQSSIRGSMKSCGPSTISVAISPLWPTGRSRHHVVHDYYRITLPTVVLSEFPCDSGCTTFGILGISQSLADVIPGSLLPVADMEEIPRHSNPWGSLRG